MTIIEIQGEQYSIEVLDYSPSKRGNRAAPAGESYPEPAELNFKIPPSERERMYDNGVTIDEVRDKLFEDLKL